LPCPPGIGLGPYGFLAPPGAGGMGALKVLSAALARDSRYMARAFSDRRRCWPRSTIPTSPGFTVWKSPAVFAPWSWSWWKGPPWRTGWRFTSGPPDNLEAYLRNSRVYYAKNVTTPLAILRNDKEGAVDWT
jgi:hypothetical protein